MTDELIEYGDEMAFSVGPLFVWITKQQGHNQMPPEFTRLFNSASAWQGERRKNQCMWCAAKPAKGFAEIDGRRYCHEGESPTCYELAQRSN